MRHIAILLHICDVIMARTLQSPCFTTVTDLLHFCDRLAGAASGVNQEFPTIGTGSAGTTRNGEK